MTALPNPLLAWGLMQFGTMKFTVSGDARLQPLSFRLKKKDVEVYATNRALETRLDEIDRKRPIERVFVMGCGRSGTWLLTGLMSTFKDTCVVSKEVPIEFFSQLTTTGRTLVLKRDQVSFEEFAEIPSRIKIVYAIRHPYDVLTSYNPMSARLYHIDPKRWRGEMVALKSVLESGRKDLCIVRYEDMVTAPDAVQKKLASDLSLEAATSAAEFADIFKPSEKAKSAMHGLRGIDTSSLYKYRNDPTKTAYLKSIKADLGDELDWVAKNFSYDTTLT